MTSAPPVPARRSTGAPAPLLFVVGAVSQYFGAAVAVLLFAAVAPVGVAWLRVASAAVLMAAWRRPWRRGWPSLSSPTRSRRLFRVVLVLAFGTALAGMNTAFYLAVARLPLGTAVAIEFLGPIAVAVGGTRTRRDVAALALALAGVGCLLEVRAGGAPEGVAWALAAAGLWAVYILLGHRVAAGGRGVDGLTTGILAGTLALAPIGVPAATSAFLDARLFLACIAVGALSSVLPYALDQYVLARMSPGRFALLLSLLPATATAVGAIALGQLPTALEALGIALVVVAVAVRGR